MEKVIYPLWRDADRDPAEVAEAVHDGAVPRLLDLGARGLRVCLETPEAVDFRWGAGPDGTVLAGGIAVWLDSVDDHPEVEALVARTGCRTAGYLVTESVPKAYDEVRWPLGDRSPGVAIFTVFPRRAGLDDEAFFRTWHGVQTPLTFELHPITVYIRNAVARTLTAGAPEIAGIVEESVAGVEELLDPMLFYSASSAEDLDARLARSMEVHEGFTDMRRLATVGCAETLYRVVST